MSRSPSRVFRKGLDNNTVHLSPCVRPSRSTARWWTFPCPARPIAVGRRSSSVRTCSSWSHSLSSPASSPSASSSPSSSSAAATDGDATSRRRGRALRREPRRASTTAGRTVPLRTRATTNHYRRHRCPSTTASRRPASRKSRRTASPSRSRKCDCPPRSFGPTIGFV